MQLFELSIPEAGGVEILLRKLQILTAVTVEELSMAVEKMLKTPPGDFPSLVGARLFMRHGSANSPPPRRIFGEYL